MPNLPFLLDLKPQTLREDLIRLPHDEPGASARGIPASGYALLSGSRAILVDAVFADTLPGVRALAASGFLPAALVLTHRHVAAQAEVLPALVREFALPVFLDPQDAAHPQAQRWPGLAYADPHASALLSACGVETLPFSGHTEGHVMLYRSAGGGLLLAGDCAVGPTVPEAEAGDWRVVRPPVFFNVDDGALRRAWEGFLRPISSLCPYHGVPLVGRPEAMPAALHSLRSATPTADLPGG